ncbi:SAM-dependent methyltransferase [Mobilitalea sibirica]|uniref:SAM-dependent methyltransferase n=1 Tax=Mobilitalea sibirica TaxID=1462919 RepID=A0A8J7GY66_9FIRM|nr:class I SAM-dependent methyltransferase [Mobilitalea sibirica]MBH1940344.1 SAM-dependent methyltransferase [Mobilitalea sibirica]
MQISKRLQAVAGMVTRGNRVADIGCDHAYTSIYLIENNISPKAIAMDVNQGPMERALENIKKYGYESKIIVRKSDGLEQLSQGEADSILIAGMGGNLMNQILSARPDVVGRVRELVLQPQSEVHQVREHLMNIGFLITAENMIKEDGQYYVMMKAEPEFYVKNKEPYRITLEEHYYYGRLLLEHQNPVLREFLLKERNQYEEIYEALLQWPTDKSIIRQKEILSMTELIDKGLKYYS